MFWLRGSKVLERVFKLNDIVLSIFNYCIDYAILTFPTSFLTCSAFL